LRLIPGDEETVKLAPGGDERIRKDHPQKRKEVMGKDSGGLWGCKNICWGAPLGGGGTGLKGGETIFAGRKCWTGQRGGGGGKVLRRAASKTP